MHETREPSKAQLETRAELDKTVVASLDAGGGIYSQSGKSTE